MNNTRLKTKTSDVIRANTVAVIILLAISLLLSACGRETDYYGFADSYHKLLFDSENYDTYLTQNKPQDSEFFYPCLEKNRARHAADAQARINACYDQCGVDDSVCNFHCNTSSGTEYVEARRDLLDLEETTLKQNLDLATLQLQGYYMGQIECMSYNLLRTEVQGLSALSCPDIAETYKNNYISENICTFKKQFYWSDWEIT